eukprot:scaffold38195_cov64-Phaeocystis_antarctica.AAC.9
MHLGPKPLDLVRVRRLATAVLCRGLPIVHVDLRRAAQHQLELGHRAAGTQLGPQCVIQKDAQALANSVDLLPDGANEMVLRIQLQVLFKVVRRHLDVRAVRLQLDRDPPPLVGFNDKVLPISVSRAKVVALLRIDRRHVVDRNGVSEHCLEESCAPRDVQRLAVVECHPRDAPEQCKVCKVVGSMRPASVEALEQAAVRIDDLLDRLSKPLTPHTIALGSLATERDVHAPCLGIDLPCGLMHAQGIAEPLEHVVAVHDQIDVCIRAHVLHLETQLRVEPAALGFQVEQRGVGEQAWERGVDEGHAIPKRLKESSGASDLGDESEAVGVLP